MLINIADIRESFFNPKKALSKKEYKALKRSVEKFGFARSLIVCNDFEGINKYICLDGHTALELLHEMGVDKVDCQVVENVKDAKSLKEFIAGYSIRKEPLYYEIYKELGEDFEEIIGRSIITIEETLKEKQDAVSAFIEGIDNADEIETYILSLKNSTIKQVRNKLRANKKISKDERILKEIDKIDDTRLLSALTELIYGGE